MESQQKKLKKHHLSFLELKSLVIMMVGFVKIDQLIFNSDLKFVVDVDGKPCKI